MNRRAAEVSVRRHRTPRGPRRATAFALLLALVGAALTACSGGFGAAEEAAARYLDLVATGDESELEALWAAAISDDPGALRAAGDLLVGATERIEVGEVGTAETAADASLPFGAVDRLDNKRVLQVAATYTLAGTEHEVVLRLAPRSAADLDDPDSWLVLEAPVGSLGFVDAGFSDVAVDAYVSGVRSVERQEQPMYPAVYSVQERLDPYLDAAPVEVTVLPGDPTVVSAFDLEPTAATTEALTASLLANFDQCESEVIGCPVFEIIERNVSDPWTEPWWGGLVTEPTLTLVGGTFEATDGVFAYTTTDGTRTEVPVNITGVWAFDNQTWTPAVFRVTATEGPP